jgi:hypothetical protein
MYMLTCGFVLKYMYPYVHLHVIRMPDFMNSFMHDSPGGRGGEGKVTIKSDSQGRKPHHKIVSPAGDMPVK